MSQTGVVDFSVGALVWIRRRNGSWWPGKIVGPEELSDGHLVSSARPGTPVKLLGKEDASVDWYNLEKSKRVKPFRCGEFDDCIERAESSHGMLPKKREKYARREDAVLHALEIEKKFLGGKYGKLGGCSNSNSSKSFDLVEKALVPPSECLGKDSGKCVQSHSKKLDLSIEDKTVDHPLHAKKVKEGMLLVRDEDNSEIMPRTRGLQNVGLKISHLKRKLASSVGLNGSRKPGFDNNAENTVHANNTSYLDQGMKSNEVLASESLVRRRDGRRPFDQVLQSTAYLQLHHSWRHDNDNVPMVTSEEEQTRVTYRAKRGRFVDLPRESSDFSDDKQFCTNQIAIPPSHFEESNCPDYAALDEVTAPENTETDSSETDSVDSDADEEIAELPDAAPVTGLEVKSLRRSGTQVSYGSTSSEEPNDLVLTSDVSHLSPRNPVGVLKWKLKGKRNNCVISKRSNDLAERRVFMSSMYRTNFEERESNAWGEPDLTENNFRRSGALTSEGTSKGLDDFTHTIIDWEDFSLNDHLVVRGYWEEGSSNYFDPALVDRDNSVSWMKSMLVDVDLQVQSSYQREHVPLISLMSKLNGKAIVGHPIQIEALEDSAAEILLSVADGIENNGTEEPPVGRTARRTAEFPVQRPNPLAELDGEDNGHKAICCPLDRRYSRKQPKKISSSSRKNIKARRYSRKQPKKISLSSSKKIKALSSIGKDQKLRKDLKEGIETFQAYGLIKGESVPTAVACIPVKLVFSRLHEELVGRHQLKNHGWPVSCYTQDYIGNHSVTDISNLSYYCKQNQDFG